MNITLMTGRTGRPVANQYKIVAIEDGMTVEYFQSYKSTIARKEYSSEGKISLDSRFWDYSVTTGKYRNQFLGENKAETLKKIKSGEYKLVNLNA